jgi:hypothetical protein
MTISELVKQLELIKEDYGDVQVRVSEDGSFFVHVDIATIKTFKEGVVAVVGVA